MLADHPHTSSNQLFASATKTACMRTLKTINICATFLLLAGCATTSTDYLKSASSTPNCDEKIHAYEAAIRKEYFVDDRIKFQNSEIVSQAISGLKTIKSCDRYRSNVASDLNSIVSELVGVLPGQSHSETEAVTTILLDHLDKYPDIYIHISLQLPVRIYRINKQQSKKIIDIAIERGLWSPRDINLETLLSSNSLFSLPDEFKSQYASTLERLKSQLNIAEMKARSATDENCTFSSCHNHALTARFRQIYTQALRETGLSNSARAKIADKMANTSAQWAQEERTEAAESTKTQSMISDAVGALVTVTAAMQSNAISNQKNNKGSDEGITSNINNTQPDVTAVHSEQTKPYNVTSSNIAEYKYSNNGGATVSNSRAPYIGGSCIQFGIWGKDNFTNDIKKITSNCNVPVEVVYCFHMPGNPSECNKGIGWGNSNKIKPGGYTLVNQRNTKYSSYLYHVCDMSDSNKQLCIRPK